jgi:hypothetical protein
MWVINSETACDWGEQINKFVAAELGFLLLETF